MTTALTKPDRTHDALAKLEAGLAQLLESDRWLDYLKVQSRFHTYSFNNCLLIAMQCPHATQVAGFNAWKHLGRLVQKGFSRELQPNGQKAIWILAPMKYKRQETHAETGEVVELLGIRGFKSVPVFDLAQTDGEPLPSAPISPLLGCDLGLFEALRQFSQQRGWSVKVEALGGPNGVCRFRTHEIVIDSGLSPLHRAKTLAHEIAHSLLHDSAEYAQHRGDMELEAESVAFVVLDYFDLDSGEYSFGYVASWQGSKDAIAQVRRVGQRVQTAARQIIDALESPQAEAKKELQGGLRGLRG